LEIENKQDRLDVIALIISLGPTPRNPKLLSQLQGQGITSKIVQGVNGRLWTEPFDPSIVNIKRFKTVVGMLPIGPEIGCALSHFLCAREAANLNAHYVIVLEDDANIESDLRPALEEIKTLDSKQPSVLQLHSYNYSILRRSSVFEVKSEPNHIIGQFYTPPKSTAAYCMNRAAIEVFASKTVVEGVADWPPFANSIRFWGYFPSPVATIGGASTIESVRKEAASNPGRNEWYVLQLRNYLKLFSFTRFREHSQSLGSRRAYIRYVLIPQTLYILRYFKTTQHGNFPNIYKLR